MALDLSKVEDRLEALEKRAGKLEEVLIESGIIRKSNDGWGIYMYVNIDIETQRSILTRLMDELGYETEYVASQPSYTEVVKKKPVRKRKA